VRAVLDPGVLIAGLISSAGAPRALLRLWLEGAFELICSALLLAELERVLLRPKFRTYATESEVRAFIELLNRLATIVPDPPPLPGITPDPKDDYLVALARSSGARVLVSGDRHLCDLVDPQPPVLTPRAFLDRLQPPAE
jgi:putative PIN family toxin of toxin-antitoxin system